MARRGPIRCSSLRSATRSSVRARHSRIVAIRSPAPNEDSGPLGTAPAVYALPMVIDLRQSLGPIKKLNQQSLMGHSNSVKMVTLRVIYYRMNSADPVPFAAVLATGESHGPIFASDVSGCNHWRVFNRRVRWVLNSTGAGFFRALVLFTESPKGAPVREGRQNHRAHGRFSPSLIPVCNESGRRRSRSRSRAG